jgi:hypothetical protein
MNTQAAQPGDVDLLLASFENLKGGKATPDDYVEGSRMATLGIEVQGIVACIQNVARRNGPGWRPHSLRYFSGAVADLKGQPVQFTYARPYVLPADPAETPLTAEERQQWATRLRQVTRERLGHGR